MRFFRHGFTLLESSVVVLTLGILAAIFVPRFSLANDDARVAAAGEDILRLSRALELYSANKGYWPAETAIGALPPEIRSGFVGADNPFSRPCPIGGLFDYDRKPIGGAGTVVCIAIKPTKTAPAPNLVDLQALDAYLDDGVLDRGKFRMLPDHKGYAYILN